MDGGADGTAGRRWKATCTSSDLPSRSESVWASHMNCHTAEYRDWTHSGIPELDIYPLDRKLCGHLGKPEALSGQDLTRARTLPRWGAYMAAVLQVINSSRRAGKVECSCARELRADRSVFLKLARCWPRSRDMGDWYVVAEQPATAPHLTRPEGRDRKRTERNQHDHHVCPSVKVL